MKFCPKCGQDHGTAACPSRIIGRVTTCTFTVPEGGTSKDSLLARYAIMEAALREIADLDFRGNPSPGQAIARRTLKELGL